MAKKKSAGTSAASSWWAERSKILTPATAPAKKPKAKKAKVKKVKAKKAKAKKVMAKKSKAKKAGKKKKR